MTGTPLSFPLRRFFYIVVALGLGLVVRYAANPVLKTNNEAPVHIHDRAAVRNKTYIVLQVSFKVKECELARIRRAKHEAPNHPIVCFW
jgi:hypothetical protein